MEIELLKLKHQIEKKGFFVQIIQDISPYYLRKMFNEGYIILMIKPKDKTKNRISKIISIKSGVIK